MSSPKTCKIPTCLPHAGTAQSDMFQTDWFKRRMRQLRVTQRHLGLVLGCDRTVVSRIIGGKQQLRLDQAELIAEALKVSPMEVLRRAGFWESGLAGYLLWQAMYDAMSPDERDRISKAVRELIGRDLPDV